MGYPETKQIIDNNFSSYVNISPANNKLQATLLSIDGALAASGSPWTESGGKVRLVTISNEVELPNGTLAAPVMAFTSEPNMGFYRQSVGLFSFVSSGTLIGTFSATDKGIRLHSAGSTTLYNLWVAQSSTFINFYGSGSTSELVVGRVGTASQTAHATCIVRAGGAIASGRTNQNAIDLKLEVGQATGSGSGANITFFTYAGGGATGTSIRATEEAMRIDGTTGDITNFSSTNSSIWRVESNSITNFSSGGSVTELAVGRLGTSTVSAHSNVTIRAGGAVTSGRLNQDGVTLKLEVGQATGDGSAASIEFYTYEGGGTSATTIRATYLSGSFDGATGDLKNYNISGEASNWSTSSESSMNFYTDNVTTTELLVGRIGNASQSAHQSVVIRAGGVITNGVITDSDAVSLTFEVGSPTGAGAAADIDFYTYDGGLASATTIRSLRRAVNFEGSTGYIYNYNVNASDYSVWNTESANLVNIYTNNSATCEFLIGKIGDASTAPQTSITLKASGVIASGLRTDQNAVSLKIEIGEGTGSGGAADITFHTYSGGGATGTTLRLSELHSTMFGSGVFAVSNSASVTFASLDGSLLALKAVSTAPTTSTASHGGLFVEGNNLKFIAPDNSVSTLSSVWNRSGTTISFANSGDFLNLNGTSAQLGIGTASGPSGGAGNTNALVLSDNTSDFTTGVASTLSLFVNGTDLKSIDGSNVIRKYLSNVDGTLHEIGSYTGDGSSPKTINLTNSSLTPAVVVIYGAPGSASPVDEDAAVLAVKFGSTMSILGDDLSGSPELKMEADAISAVAAGSFSVGDRLNISSTGYSYLVIGKE